MSSCPTHPQSSLCHGSSQSALWQHLSMVLHMSAAGLQGEESSGTATSCKASVLRCLAAAERLPPLDWAQICAPFLR